MKGRRGGDKRDLVEAVHLCIQAESLITYLVVEEKSMNDMSLLVINYKYVMSHELFLQQLTNATLLMEVEGGEIIHSFVLCDCQNDMPCTEDTSKKTKARLCDLAP